MGYKTKRIIEQKISSEERSDNSEENADITISFHGITDVLEISQKGKTVKINTENISVFSEIINEINT